MMETISFGVRITTAEASDITPCFMIFSMTRSREERMFSIFIVSSSVENADEKLSLYRFNTCVTVESF